MEYIFGLSLNSLLSALAICFAFLFAERRVNNLKEDNASLHEDNVSLQAELAKVIEDSCLDPLTKLLNRRGLTEWLKKIVADAQRKKGTFCVALIDIDFFKRINDTYGHDAGDKVLVALANVILGDVLRAGDLRVRYGGEEFLVVMPDITAEQSFVVVNRLRQAVEGLSIDVPEEKKVTATASFGVAEYRLGEDPSETIRRADTALYEAKNGGRNKVVVAGE